MARWHRLLIITAVALSALSRAAAQADETASRRAAGLLDAMGGAAVWREVVGARISATHYSNDLARPYRNVIWNDFARFRLHIEARGPDIVSLQGYDGAIGRRDNGRDVIPIPPARVAEERRWWHANVYRTLHRLARADSALGVRMLGTDRLAVYEDGDRLLAWFGLNPANEPVLFGTNASSPGTVFGPLASHVSGARYPRWGSSPDGSWRYEVHDAEFLTRPPVMPPVPGSD